MTKAAARRAVKDFGAMTITRLLIALYFVALATGLVKGADFGALAEHMIGRPAADIVMSGLVIAMVVAVLIDFHRRTAALLLALTVFCASYVTILANDDLRLFWRDVALIGAMLAAFGTPISGSNDDEADVEEEQEPTTFTPRARPASTLFREDLEVARST